MENLEMNGRKVFVTGAHGLLGFWLTKELINAGADITILQRDHRPDSPLILENLDRKITTVSGDICDSGLLRRVFVEYEIDTVFHLAAQTIVGNAMTDPTSTYDSNIRGTWTLLEACRLNRVNNIIVASSDKAYGAHDQLPYREDFPLKPQSPYDVSKAATDLIAQSYFHTFGLPVVITRCANLYGGGDSNNSRLIPEVIDALIDGRAPIIRSDGTPRRDFLYVEDAVAAYLKLSLELGCGTIAGEVFNIGNQKPHSVKEVVELICQIADRHIQPDIRGDGNPTGEIANQYVDSTKIQQTVGWTPQFSLEDGLKRTWDWYCANRQRQCVDAA